jgi:hypothetical protein
MDDLQPQENRVKRSPDLDPMRVMLIGLILLGAAQVYTFLRLRKLKASLNQHLASQSDSSGPQMEEIEQQISMLDQAYGRVVHDERKQKPTGRDAMLSNVDFAKAQLRKNASAVQAIQVQQKRSTEELESELGEKADSAQVGVLFGNLSATQKDLASTNNRLQHAVSQLGMERSKLGTLTARNHNEIEKLQALGERDYFEFTLHRSARPQPVGGVGLRLRKTDRKRLRYTVDIYADDCRMEEQGRGINEPIFFYVRSSRQPAELVVNDVQRDTISGYLSALKGTMRDWPLKPDPEWEPFQELKRRPAEPEPDAAAGLPPSGAGRPN